MTPVRRRLFFEPGVIQYQEPTWCPATDILRAPYGWLIKVELPGVAVDQVRVTVQGNSLVLSGVRRDTLHEEGDSYYAMEIAYSRFERRIELPSRIEGAELRISSHNGLLVLRVLVTGEPGGR